MTASDGLRSLQAEQVISRQRTSQALEGKLANGLGLDDFLDGAEEAIRDEDLTTGRGCAQPRRLVRDAAESRVVPATLEAD